MNPLAIIQLFILCSSTKKNTKSFWGLIQAFRISSVRRRFRKELLNPTSTRVALWVNEFHRKYDRWPRQIELGERGFVKVNYLTSVTHINEKHLKHSRVSRELADLMDRDDYYFDFEGNVWLNDADDAMLLTITLDLS